MWVLFVINPVFDVDTPALKWTRYSNFETHESCLVTKVLIEEQFNMNELAVCVKDE